MFGESRKITRLSLFRVGEPLIQCGAAFPATLAFFDLPKEDYVDHLLHRIAHSTARRFVPSPAERALEVHGAIRQDEVLGPELASLSPAFAVAARSAVGHRPARRTVDKELHDSVTTNVHPSHVSPGLSHGLPARENSPTSSGTSASHEMSAVMSLCRFT